MSPSFEGVAMAYEPKDVSDISRSDIHICPHLPFATRIYTLLTITDVLMRPSRCQQPTLPYLPLLLNSAGRLRTSLTWSCLAI